MRIIQWLFPKMNRKELTNSANKGINPTITCFSAGNILILIYSDKLKEKWIETSRGGYYGFRKDGLLLIGVLHQTGNGCRYSAISFFDFYLLLALFMTSILFSLPNFFSGLIWGLFIVSIVSLINRSNNSDEEILRNIKDYLTDCEIR